MMRKYDAYNYGAIEMRTTVDINEDLLDATLEATGHKSKSKAVNEALGVYVTQRRRERLLALRGNLDLDLDDWYEFRHMDHTQ